MMPSGVPKKVDQKISNPLPARALASPPPAVLGGGVDSVNRDQAEYGRKSPLAEVIRFINDILLSAPSIVVGLFVYTLVVSQMQHFSGWAGVIALALLQVPIVIRTTENMMRLVPDSMP